jgi:tetratricopeptide (TPR) repeat protein
LNSKQLIAIGVALAATAGIYWGTSNVKPAKGSAEASHNHSADDGHDHAAEAPGAAGPMMGGAMAMVPPANFDSLLAATKKKLLSPQTAAEINHLETDALTNKDKTAQAASYKALGDRWQKMNQFGIAAHYYAEAGNLENSEKILNFAAHLFQEALSEEKDAAVRQWLAEGRIASLNKVINIDPKSDTLEMDIAVAMIDRGDVMNGVFKLRDFAEKHPQNIRAQVTLGKMALQSNQTDKAIERGVKVLALDKNNLEAHLFMGEAYKMQGNLEKAIELFNEAKAIMKNPAFDKDMDAYIATFNKQQKP